MGRDDFYAFYHALLALWGVSLQHKGTYVLAPEEWRSAAPLNLAAMVDPHNHPPMGAPRACYSYGDHATTLARALAWYAVWPRTGADLDVFLECGPFKPMDASYLCHHEHCIVHLTYEPANFNQARKECRRRAVFLRRERKPVPKCCTEHNPPCMMQVRYSARLCSKFRRLTVDSMRHCRPRKFIDCNFKLCLLPKVFHQCFHNRDPGDIHTLRLRADFYAAFLQSR